MECSFCSGNQATCHLTKLVNGKVIDVHVCEKCIPEVNQENLLDFDIWDAVSKLAAKKGIPDPGKSVEPDPIEISAKSLLFQSPTSAITCEACGFTSDDVRKTGRLGCPECYEAFGVLLQDVINNCQKSVQHTGKVPSHLKDIRKERLEEQLQQAVKEERFEDAAILKEQITKL